VSLAVHNLKLQTALQLYKVPVWPFTGAVAIKDGYSMLVINKWCYLGTANDHDELDNLAQSENLDFDLDIYKIVKKAITGSHKTNVVKLSGAQEAVASFDVTGWS
jgi:DNA polymerase-3 subunit epsilon